MTKVFIGVGHGGKDPGATANGVQEANLNLAIALSARDELVRHGVEVLMSRTKDEDDTLDDEIKECNAFKPDLAIDFHNNAGGGDGAEAFYQKQNPDSKELATLLIEEVKKTGQNSRGIKTKLITSGANKGKDWFGFLRLINATAVLVEFAFVDTKDVEIIDTSAEQKAMGIAAAKAILRKLGVSYKEVTAGAEKPTENAVVIGEGDLVSISKDAVYYNGWFIPPWVKQHNWYVDIVKGDRAVLGKSQSGYNNINSPINTAYLTVIKKAENKVSNTTATTKPTATQKDDFLPKKGYFMKGDVSPNVGKIATFMRKNFPAYTSEKALGNTYGVNLIKAVTEFQKRTGLEPDGYFGKLTLAKLEEYGFKR